MTSLNSFDMETIDYLKVRSTPVTYLRHIQARGELWKWILRLSLNRYSVLRWSECIENYIF